MKKAIFLIVLSIAGVLVVSGCSDQNFSSLSSDSPATKTGDLNQGEDLIDDDEDHDNTADDDADHKIDDHYNEKYACSDSEYGDSRNGRRSDSLNGNRRSDSLNDSRRSDDSLNDSRRSDDSRKVLICHIPPGNPNARHEICISANALRAHLEHGSDAERDYLGYCDYGGYDNDDRDVD